MFFFVFGLPGEFTEWCRSVVLALVQRGGGSAGLLSANTLEEIALGAIGAGISHAVVTSHRPGGRLRQAVVEHGQRFIVAYDGPHAALTDLVIGHEIDLPAAVQQVASGCAALGAMADAPGALCLAPDRDRDWQMETAEAIARHLGFRMSLGELSKLVRGVDGVGAAAADDILGWWSGLDGIAQELASAALGPFTVRQSEGEPLSIAWSRELFFLGDRPDERVTGPIDITGRARCLLHGPYIVLPPGLWSLSLTASFLHGALEHDFAVEVHADHLLAEGMIVPRREGGAATTLDFTVDARTEQPMSIRISSRRAAFDGVIATVAATLARRLPDSEDAAA